MLCVALVSAQVALHLRYVYSVHTQGIMLILKHITINIILNAADREETTKKLKRTISWKKQWQHNNRRQKEWSTENGKRETVNGNDDTAIANNEYYI